MKKNFIYSQAEKKSQSGCHPNNPEIEMLSPYRKNLVANILYRNPWSALRHP